MSTMTHTITTRRIARAEWTKLRTLPSTWRTAVLTMVMAIGFGLEHDGVTPIHHVFALASLLIVFKVPGAMGGGEKAAHKLQSTMHEAMTHIVKAVAKA